MKFKRLLRIVPALALLMAGCSDDDCKLSHPGSGLDLPAIEQGSFPSSDLELEAGRSYTYAPRVITPGKTYYRWLLNDEEVSTKSSYTLSVANPTRSVVKLELSNDNGTTTLENRVIAGGADYRGKYLIINEGWFGHERGSVTAYDPADGTLVQRALSSQNFGQLLGITTQSATIWNDKLFICSKDGNHLTIADPQTLYVTKQSGAILGKRQAYEFIGIDDRYGIITANGDIYRVDYTAEDLTAEQILMSDTWGGCGSGTVFAGKLIINVKGKKLHVLDLDKVTGDLSGYNWSSYFPFTTIDVTTSGGCRFVQCDDGNLYTVESTSAGNNLVRIKPDLSIEKTPMTADYAPSDFASYREAPFCGTADGTFYYVAKGKIYRCTFDDAATARPLTEYTKDGYSFYGAGVRVNPTNSEVIATYVSDDYGKNLIVRFDGHTGELISETEYDHYWFPATVVFPY